MSRLINELKFGSFCQGINITATEQRGIPACYHRLCPYYTQDPPDSCSYYIRVWEEEKVKVRKTGGQ